MLKTEQGKRLYRKCRLAREQQDLELQKQSLKDRLPEAKAAKREADVSLHEYQCGGFRAFLDKLSGKQEEKLDMLTRSAAAASSALDSLQRELERVESSLKKVSEEMDALGEPADVVEQALSLENEEREVILHMAASTAAAKLIPMLETAASALEEAQEWARPNNRIDVAPGYTKGMLLSRAESCARECHESLQRIARCGILLDIHPYFYNPSGYIHGVAAQYAELDRINSALAAIRQTLKQAEELILQLEE